MNGDLTPTDRRQAAIALISAVIWRLQHRCKINQDPHLLDWIGDLEDARNHLKEAGELDRARAMGVIQSTCERIGLPAAEHTVLALLDGLDDAGLLAPRATGGQP